MREYTVGQILRETCARFLNSHYLRVEIYRNGDGTSKIILKNISIFYMGAYFQRVTLTIPLVTEITDEDNFFISDIRYYLDKKVLKDSSGCYYTIEPNL